MARYQITLTQQEHKEVLSMADRENRNIRDQLKLFVMEGLDRRRQLSTAGSIGEVRLVLIGEGQEIRIKPEVIRNAA